MSFAGGAAVTRVREAAPASRVSAGVQIAGTRSAGVQIAGTRSAGMRSAGVQIVGFVALTALAAQVQVRVPGLLVPVTLQSLAVLLCGYALSPWRACAAMSAYLAAGSVVAGATGGAWGLFTPGSVGLFGPTAGYLAGFVLAAPVVSVLFLRRSGLTGAIVAGVAGTAIIFACGVGWLTVLLGSASSAAAQGLVPFLPGAGLKLAAAVAAVQCARAARRA